MSPPRALPPYARKQLLASRESATSVDKGHGRVERRTLTTTTLLNDYLRGQGWPDVGQVFRLERRRTIRGETTVEVAYGLTSLSPQQAGPAQLLALVRGHWAIENSLHYVRDVTLGEDACRVRTGSAPLVLAVVRNLIVTLAYRQNAPTTAEAIRRFANLPLLAVQSVVLPQE